MDGTYISAIKTARGMKQGKLNLVTNDNKASGSIEIMGMRSNFTNGTIDGNTCKFSGTFRSFFGSVSYEAIGTLTGDEMKLIANTSKGKFEFTGKKQ